MKICLIGCLVGSMLFGQILYEEHFTDGAMKLEWHPWFAYAGSYDSMQVISDPTTPGGDGWAGKISNELAGGQAGATYAGADDLDDYSIEAWIYTTVSAAMGPYNGVAMRMDTTTHAYYRFVSDFDNNARLRLGVFAGGAAAVVLRDWTSGEIPGGVPPNSSWHKFKMVMVADSVWCFYDDVELPGCPVIDTVGASAQGYFGVYVFNFTGIDSTKCDDIIVRAEPTGVVEYTTEAPSFLTVRPNPFTHETDIRWQIADNRQKVVLKIYDLSGRLVRYLPGLPSSIGQQLSVRWDGRDDAGQVLAPGVYFIQDEKSEHLEKVVKLP